VFICLSLIGFRGLKSPHYQSHLCDRSSLSSRLPFFSFFVSDISLSLSLSHTHTHTQLWGLRRRCWLMGKWDFQDIIATCMNYLLLLPSYSFHLTNCRQHLTSLAAHRWTRAPLLCYIFCGLLTFSYLPNAFLHVPCHWLVEPHNSSSSLSHKP
jgi:hypothetical protein